MASGSGEDGRGEKDALIGRTIAGKFTIESRVGGGGMGSVYRARQTGLNKVVAVKVLHRELLAEPTFASRFKREATSASRIDHPSSLRVLDFGEEPDGLLFIAMEFLEGRTLFKVLREEAPLAPGRIVDLSRQILAALAAAHDLGIVHRDLKPENVIILPGKDDDGSPTEHVKVCDFGIAKLQTEGDADEKLTLEGAIVGTPEYLSPEQARGGEIDLRSDIYSMGVIVFEMLTGQPPFRGDSPLAIVLKHLDATPPRPSSLAPAVDPKIEEVCLKALSKSPGDRFASAREMRAALVTDMPDAAAPPFAARGTLLAMAETPPPVSSTQSPVPLTSRRPTLTPTATGSSGSGQRLRLSDISGPEPTSSSRPLFAVIGAALLLGAGGGGAYWMKHSVHPPVVTAAHDGPTIAPSSTVAAQVDPTSPSPAPTDSAQVAPPPEMAAPAPSASAARRRRTKAAAGSKESTTPDPAGEVFVEDLSSLAPKEAPTTPAKVHFSHIEVKGIADTNVTAALPVSRFARCYHGAPGSHASISLHIDLTPSGATARCAIGDQSLAELGSCIAGAANSIHVSGVPGGGASADVDVNLDAP